MSIILRDVTNLATCFKLLLSNGAIVGFTDYDQDLKIDNIIYKAGNSFSYSNIESASFLSIDNLHIEGVLSSDFISERDIVAGKYNNTKVEIFKVNYNNLNKERIILKSGTIGKISILNNQFVAEINGMSQKAKRQIVDIFSPSCRAQFCDHLCSLDSNDFTHYGAVTKITTGRRKFCDQSLEQEKNYYRYGIVSFIDSENKDFSIEVKSSGLHELELFVSTPYEIKIDDKYTIIAGCDKLPTTCAGKFKNFMNFRGEPYVPGVQRLF